MTFFRCVRKFQAAFFIGKNQRNMQDADMESLKYDSATYADLVASQLQEERYATWVFVAQKISFRERLMAGCFFFFPPFSF